MGKGKDNLMYAYAYAYPPASTVSLLASSLLVFSTLFGYFIMTNRLNWIYTIVLITAAMAIIALDSNSDRYGNQVMVSLFPFVFTTIGIIVYQDFQGMGPEASEFCGELHMSSFSSGVTLLVSWEFWEALLGVCWVQVIQETIGSMSLSRLIFIGGKPQVILGVSILSEKTHLTDPYQIAIVKRFVYQQDFEFDMKLKNKNLKQSCCAS
ncbi:hypothetical protein RJ641_027676 [Dillenia turbinata]|uniref:Uncharacterized protein n=1 Tax=Dillenia turbinata TaxID=194707 RepID=A0AAN8ZIC2_9MAGN